jgi:hypothetical protein
MDGEGAEVPFAALADGDGDDGPAAPVTLAACLEPKMADTILPKTLIFFLLTFAPLQDEHRQKNVSPETALLGTGNAQPRRTHGVTLSNATGPKKAPGLLKHGV